MKVRLVDAFRPVESTASARKHVAALLERPRLDPDGEDGVLSRSQAAAIQAERHGRDQIRAPGAHHRRERAADAARGRDDRDRELRRDVRDTADAIARLVGDQVAVLGERDAARMAQACGGGDAAVAQLRAAAHGGRDRAVGSHEADAVVERVGDVEAAAGCRRDAERIVELRRQRIAAVARESGRAHAGDGRDDAGGRHLADAVVAAVGDQEAAVGRRRDSAGCRQSCERRRAAVVRVPALPDAGDGGDDAVRADLADPRVAGVGDQEAAVGRGGDAARSLERGGRRRQVIAEIDARRPSAGDRRDHPGGDHANAVVAGVGDHDGAVGEHRDPAGRGDLSRLRRSAVAAEADRAGPRDCRDDISGGDVADARIAAVGDDNAAVMREREPCRERQCGSHGLAAVAAEALRAVAHGGEDRVRSRRGCCRDGSGRDEHRADERQGTRHRHGPGA